MKRAQGLLAVALLVLASRGARADDSAAVCAESTARDASGRAARTVNVNANASVKTRVRAEGLRRGRSSHVDTQALSAGALLFGVGYAIALATPVARGFDRESRHFAVPLAGPWLARSDLTWGWALDGLLQFGGVLFAARGFAAPITELGTPQAKVETEPGSAHLVHWAMRF